MAAPTSRTQFKDYCMRKLGAPVVEINVADEQVEDRIDEALKYFADYHYDGSAKMYYKHQITDEDKVNRYIPLPENIMGAVSIFPLFGMYTTNDGLFSIQYQFALNDLHTLTSQSLVPYYMSMQHLSLIEEILVGKQPIRFNRHMNRCYIDMNWSKVDTGEFLVIEAYQVVDPVEWVDVWGDRWLQEFATELIKKQWGTNLKKFKGMSLPGGVQFSGQELYDEATEAIEKLKSFDISEPVGFLLG